MAWAGKLYLFEHSFCTECEWFFIWLCLIFCDNHRTSFFYFSRETIVFHTWITVSFAPNRCQPFHWFLWSIYLLYCIMLIMITGRGSWERGYWQGYCQNSCCSLHKNDWDCLQKQICVDTTAEWFNCCDRYRWWGKWGTCQLRKAKQLVSSQDIQFGFLGLLWLWTGGNASQHVCH
jgi:hypothetical protein